MKRISALILLAVLLTAASLNGFLKSSSALNLQHDVLAPCPSSPNCVSSEDAADTRHYIAPIILPAN